MQVYKHVYIRIFIYLFKEFNFMLYYVRYQMWKNKVFQIKEIRLFHISYIRLKSVTLHF